VARVTEPLRWSMAIVELDPTVGHEQRGRRRALVVSYEAFHRAGLATVCPISAREARYPGEVAIPRGEAGQTEDAVILCHQLRTIDLGRVAAFEIDGVPQRIQDPAIRGRVRSALAHHLGLDIRAPLDGAA
jgi:mRNA-degrading endonuclease toxin of MazEF toxin-antitoxin module